MVTLDLSPRCARLRFSAVGCDGQARGLRPAGLGATAALHLTVAAGAEITLRLDITPAPGWTLEIESGEALEAFTLTHASGATSTVGLRDMGWVAETTGLTLLHSDGPLPLLARFRSDIARAVDLVIALAETETETPGPDAALANWLAVDRLLTLDGA